MSNKAGKDMTTQAIVDMIRQGHAVEELAGKEKIPSLSGYLNEMMGRKGYSVQVTSDMSDINKATLHKIMTHKMAPSRNLLLRIAFALELSFEETQTLLKSGNCATLSGSRARDLYLIEGLENRQPFDEVNDTLLAHDMPDLYSKG